MFEGFNSEELLEATKLDFLKAIEKELLFREAVTFLSQVLDALENERFEARRRAVQSGSYLSTHGIDPEKFYDDAYKEHHQAKAPTVTVDEVISWLMPMLEPKKKVKGDALLDVFAKAMYESGQAMTFTDMIEYLDEHGIEKPGVNFRNNIIGMITKAPDRFQRVSRGTYFLTVAEEQQQRKRAEVEDDVRRS